MDQSKLRLSPQRARRTTRRFVRLRGSSCCLWRICFASSVGQPSNLCLAAAAVDRRVAPRAPRDDDNRSSASSRGAKRRGDPENGGRRPSGACAEAPPLSDVGGGGPWIAASPFGLLAMTAKGQQWARPPGQPTCSTARIGLPRGYPVTRLHP